MKSKNNEFERVLAQVEQMPERQRQHIADGFEEAEHFVVKADDFPTDEEFHRAVVAEIMRLFDFG